MSPCSLGRAAVGRLGWQVELRLRGDAVAGIQIISLAPSGKRESTRHCSAADEMAHAA